MEIRSQIAGPGGGSSDRATELSRLREMAIKLEASFLAEMLKSAGLGETPEGFGGGAGEDQFGSFLRQAQAEKIAEAGGIGIAEAIFESLKRSDDA